LELSYAGVVRVSVRSGTTILFQPLGQDQARLRLFLLGSAMGALLAQRGKLVLHAGCVAMGERALAVAGNSGAGKSTTTAALVQRGCTLLSDDLVAVSQGRVCSGYPFLRLWPQSFNLLG